MKRLALVLLLVFSLIIVYGCGGGGGGGTVPTVETGKANLIISAKFPQNGQAGKIGTAYINPNTVSITVSVKAGCTFFPDGTYNCLSQDNTATLTPDNPTATISDLPIGGCVIWVESEDEWGNKLDYMSIKGRLVSGDNTLSATMIAANDPDYWVIVDNNNAPSQITLNKTHSSDQTRIDSFYVYASYPPSQGWGEPGWSQYDLEWYGYIYNGMGGFDDFVYDSLYYRNYFTGPNTSTNSLENDFIILVPGPNLEERLAFVLPNETPTDNFSEPDVLPYFNTKVTSSDTIEGTIAEVMFLDQQINYTCTDLNGNTIDCPPGVGVTKKAMAIKKNGLKQALTNRIGKSALDQNLCANNMTVSGSETWTDCADLNNDNTNCEYPVDYYIVTETYTETVNACLHPFRAILNSSVPQGNMNFTIQ